MVPSAAEVLTALRSLIPHAIPSVHDRIHGWVLYASRHRNSQIADTILVRPAILVPVLLCVLNFIPHSDVLFSRCYLNMRGLTSMHNARR